MKSGRWIFAAMGVALAWAGALAAESRTVWLTELDLTKMSSGWGRAVPDRSCTTQQLSIAGRKFERGVGTHAESTMWVELDGKAAEFAAWVGVDDDNLPGRGGSVEFTLCSSERDLWTSGPMKSGDAPKEVRVPLAGVKALLLLVDSAGDGINNDHGDWAEARFVTDGDAPKAVAAPPEEAVMLTPPPPPEPRINGPRVYGVRPGHPFLYRIPATGERPMIFGAKDLPAGLELDPQTGIVTGTSPTRGRHEVVWTAKNARGTASRAFAIVSGDTLALTPPMGWNHWYTHYNRITEDLMRQAADTMISSGMADAGYQYVNIDDCWMQARALGKYQTDPRRVGPARDEDGNILANAYFPDMKGLADYIHSKGLKAGLYTSPGPRTCAGFEGAYQHEAQDAQRFADWGYDFLKYDWCSYGQVANAGDPRAGGARLGKDAVSNAAAYRFPYRMMGDLLKQQKRDIVFNLCQYGMGEVWTWGADIGGHCWRTAGDLGFELNRIFEVALKNAEHGAWSKPGAWNDPDYLQIGFIGSQRGGAFTLAKPCPLSPTEQYAFMSLWCLSAAPLVYSGDMGRLDPFTLNVLCNPEVIEVDQDPLGRCARVIRPDQRQFVMVKDMEDGSKAVGLCNRAAFAAKVRATWGDLGLSGPQRVRDVWRQKDRDVATDAVEAFVPRRGVVLLRLWPAKP